MRILKAEVKLNELFDDFTIQFMESEKTTIHYLVGNNGAGKTHPLVALFHAVSGTAASIYKDSSVKITASLEYDARKQEVFTTMEWKDNRITQGDLYQEQNAFLITEGNLTKRQEREKKYRVAVYSEVEINFEKQSVKSPTADTPDSEIPTEISNKLNSQIPQILVNIQSQDASLRSQWMADNVGTAVPIEVPGEKMKRFREAYNKIFGGEKKLKGVEIEGGEYKVLFTDNNGTDVDVSELSSGEKQIVFRLGFILKNLDSTENCVVFIDEPEISLHPKWQLQFKKILLEIFHDKNVQIIIATHSPYIFGEIDNNIEECIRVDRIANTADKIEFPQFNQSGLNDSPSMNLVNFKAYGIPSTGLHIELYNAVQVACGSDTVKAAEEWLVTKGLPKTNYSVSQSANYLKDNGNPSPHSAEETKPTWIRNSLNHPMVDRQNFNETDLRDSIESMLNVL